MIHSIGDTDHVDQGSVLPYKANVMDRDLICPMCEPPPRKKRMFDFQVNAFLFLQIWVFFKFLRFLRSC